MSSYQKPIVSFADINVLPPACSIHLLFVFHPCRFFMDRKEFICAPGNILIFKGTCQITDFESNNNHAITAVALYPDFFDNLFFTQITDCPLFYDFLLSKSVIPEYLYFDCEQDPLISNIAAVFLHECHTTPLRLKTARASCVLLFDNLFQNHQKYLQIGHSSMMIEYLTGQMLSYVSNNYRDVTLISAAAHFNYHPTYFSTKFRQLVKCSFQDKLLEIRLQHARQMLKETDFPIQKIVGEIGFQEKSYFYRCFKRDCGMTPLAYRRKYRH